MKRKIFIMSLGILIFALLLAISSFATVDYNEKAVLADETIVPIYDENRNPLIWYVSGVDENGKNVYASVPNNRNVPNENNDTYVTYTITTGQWAQINDIKISIYDEATSAYIEYNEDNIEIVVLNFRGMTFPYIGNQLNLTNFQYVYMPETLKDMCAYFNGKTNLRLIDMSVCTNLSGGFGGERNFYNCTNLHTVRLAENVSYTIVSKQFHNLRFGNTGIVTMVIPSNIEGLGTDNFSQSKNLTNFYILGDTDLGQRNFVGCTSLTNFYVLSKNPTQSVQSFYDNFVECYEESGNKTHDLRAIGKYFFFATTDMEYLNSIKDAIGATAVISYSDYKANTNAYTEGRYVISGTNICETLNNGVHEFDESANGCAGVCTKCGEIAQKQNQAHIFSATISYANYLGKGVKYEVCSNANCQYSSKNPYISDTAPIISEFMGISTKINGDGITFGYSVNYDALNEYVMTNGNDVELGFVVAVKSFLGDKSPLDASGNASTPNVIKATLLKWTTNEETNNKIPRYISADFRIVGDWDIVVDLDCDSIPETNVKDVEFYMAGYIIDGAIVKYINYQKTSDTADYVSYNGVNG